VVTGDWGRHDLHDPRVIPLINYGVAGVNRFEHVEAAYCLNGYYVPAQAVARAVHDLDPEGHRYRVSVCVAGPPPRRAAVRELPPGREPTPPRLAERVLEQREADVVVQAVGRTRPFTSAREVITFHCGELPGVRYTQEFGSLGEARRFFDVP